MMEYDKFAAGVMRRGHHSPKRIRNSWGVYDAYKYIRRNKWYDIGRPLTEHEFYAIVRTVNNLLAEEIANGVTVVFPCGMGKLELTKYEVGAFFKDGMLKVTYPIDWEETVRLWYRDEEARKDKSLVRNENRYVYKVRYSKSCANYENKTFYRFSLNRRIKRSLKPNIEQGKIDALW